MLFNKTINNEYPIKKSAEVGTLMPTTITISCKDGILVGSFKNTFRGSKQYTEARHEKISKNNIITGSGDLSDFQNIILKIKKLENKNQINSFGKSKISPNILINYIASMNYKKRGKMDYNLVELGISGRENGKNILAYVDKFGSLIYHDRYVVTHFGNYYLKSQLDEMWHENLTINEAKEVLKKCFEILAENTKYNSKTVSFIALRDDGFIEGDLGIDIKFDN